MTGGTWEREVAENARRLGALRDRLSAQTVREVSRDGTVEVSVSTSGALTGLVLREGRFREPLPVIAAQVMDCVRRAQARIPELMGQAMAETIGPNDPAAQLILAETRERFPEPPQPRDAPPPPPVPQSGPPPARRGQDGDDWDGPEIFERG
ncbi:YbaB/EbfC family nucleoid-associated protein [Lentzea sp. NPDC058450]|uniref:YbaB/EbfC family nucleoid-associated protein n=1 Tax=Lentzea sp. NPDC058450 TaxID=3346505 RepID=UPI003654F4BD